MSAVLLHSQDHLAESSRFRWLRFALGVTVAVGSGVYFYLSHGGVLAEPPFIDEQAILAQTYYFRLFHDANFHHPDWIDWAAFDHQPVYKYSIGAMLWYGIGPHAVPESLQDWRSWMFNPTPPAVDLDLYTARWTMLCGAVFACVMVYLLGCMVRPICWHAGGVSTASPLVSRMHASHGRRTLSGARRRNNCSVGLDLPVGIPPS